MPPAIRRKAIPGILLLLLAASLAANLSLYREATGRCSRRATGR